MTPSNPPRRRGRTAGFTIVELLVVFLILALLIGLLLPAIGSAVKSAGNARVSAEVVQLSAALADFKAKYGEYPPSRILLCENGVYPTGATAGNANNLGIYPNQVNTDISIGDLAQKSMGALRRFWPRMNLDTAANFNAAYNAPSVLGTTWYDFNGNGGTGPDAPYILEGFECLVFFLGGVPSDPSGAGTNLGMTGWSKNPANPFDNGKNRQPPFFEFKSDRLVYLHGGLIPALTVPTTGNNRTIAPRIPAYLDTLGNAPTVAGTHNFYAYFSSNLGSGYDPNDCNYAEFSLQGNQRRFTAELLPSVTNPSAAQIFATFMFSEGDGTTSIQSPAPNPYTVGLTTNPAAKPTYQNPSTFQIISPGRDGLYGWGGQFDPNGSSSTIPIDTSGFVPQAVAEPSLRARENDNITNLKSGTLN